MKLLILMAAFSASVCFGGDSVVLSLCGEWKGEDGNVHNLGKDKWVTTLPNGLKKERSITLAWVSEPKGVYFTVSPVEHYALFVYPDKKRIAVFGPRREAQGHINIDATDLVTTLHLSKLNAKDGQELLDGYNKRRAAEAPLVARRRLKSISHNIATATQQLALNESELIMWTTNPPPPSKFIVEAAGSQENANANHKGYVRERINECERNKVIYRDSLQKAEAALKDLRARNPDITDEEVAQTLSAAREQLRK